MDMQNVSNLEIPEGEVRTIHDKDNRLLWGRVNYDTKYAGDTFQQTYSGKNLCEVTSVSPYNVTASLNDGTINISGTMSSAGNVSVRVNNSSFVFQPNKTYTITFYCTGTITATGAQTYRFIYMSGNAIGSLANNSNVIYTFTPTQETTITGFNFDLANGLTFNNYSVKIQIEENSSSTFYEPYVGGTASPNPDYPQDINVVTGEQTVVVTNSGGASTTKTVDLGSIELAKIGTYQDYIYKSGDDWYVHKAIDKIVLDGSNPGITWALTTTGTPIKYCFWFRNIMIGASTSMTTKYCNYFTYNNGIYKDGWPNSAPTPSLCENDSTASDGSYMFIFKTDGSQATTIAAWRTWLSNNNTTVYYALATPTDTKITDATLIGELEAVHEWLVRYGYYGTVSGNLPMIIDRTNL